MVKLCICVFMYYRFIPPDSHQASSFIAKGGWSGGAMVPSKLSVLGRPNYFNSSMARAYCVRSRYGWGFYVQFFCSSIFFSSLGDPDAQWVKLWPTDLADRVRSSLLASSSQP